MEFVMRKSMKEEFASTVIVFAQDLHFNPGMIEFDYEDDMVTAIVPDSTISKFSKVQLSELKSIK